MRKAIQYSWQITGMLLAVLWLFQTPLYAAIYKWRDDQGKLHFTDSKSKIPLKYRDQFEKFKGVAEPSPKKPEPSGDTETDSKTEETEAVQEEASTDAVENAKGPKKKKMDPELLAVLIETKKYLEKDNFDAQRLINVVEATEANGKYFMMHALKSAGTKKELVKKLVGFELPSLKSARKFLRKSMIKDGLEEMGGEDYLARILKLKRRFEKEIATKKDLISQLQADLDGAEK